MLWILTNNILVTCVLGIFSTGIFKLRYHVPVEVVPSLADVMAALQDRMIRTITQFIYIYVPFVEGWLHKHKVFIISLRMNVTAIFSADLPVVHVCCIIVCTLPCAACSLYSSPGSIFKDIKLCCAFETEDFVFWLIWMTEQCKYLFLF